MDIFRKRVKENIEKSLHQLDINADVIVDHTNNIIIKGEDINAWIRLTVLPARLNKANQVDINNIVIDSSKRRSGIFTKIMKNLKTLKTVDEIIISSVVSDEMVNWCNKNNCSLKDFYNYKYK